MDERRFKLRYLPLFRSDLAEIAGYIALQLHNPAAADKLVDAVEAAILERAACADAFEPYQSRRKRSNPYYRIYVKNYTIYYIVVDDVMEVHRILYNKRNAENLL